MARKWCLIQKMRGRKFGVSISVPADKCPPGTTDRHEVQVTLYADEVIEGDFWSVYAGTFLQEVAPAPPKVSGAALAGLGALRAKAKPAVEPKAVVAPVAATPDIDEGEVVEVEVESPTPAIGSLPHVIEPTAVRDLIAFHGEAEARQGFLDAGITPERVDEIIAAAQPATQPVEKVEEVEEAPEEADGAEADPADVAASDEPAVSDEGTQSSAPRRRRKK